MHYVPYVPPVVCDLPRCFSRPPPQDPREALIVALKREVSILQQENNHLRQLVELTESTGGDGGSQVTRRGFFVLGSLVSWGWDQLATEQVLLMIILMKNVSMIVMMFTTMLTMLCVQGSSADIHQLTVMAGGGGRNGGYVGPTDGRGGERCLWSYCMRHDLIYLDISQFVNCF